EERAAELDAELDAVMENMPQGVYVATPDGRVRSNRMARDMSGERFPREIKTLERALHGETCIETVKLPSQWIHSVAAPIFHKGKIVGGVAVNTDITQSRLKDEAMRRSEKLAAIGQLASSIAHEINNPLEAITNLLYLMRESDSMEEVQEYVRLAQEELARVTEITLQTLRFHRQQRKPVEADIGELLRMVLSLYKGRLLAREITIEMKLRDTPLVWHMDGEIRQVVNNLVRNALDAMENGGHLYVRLHSQPDWKTGRKGVRITVADTGEGIQPEIMAHLFEPFQTSKELTGTGLGLWVSQGIVQKHGGYIDTKTKRGERHGTVFAVWLPLTGGLNLVAEAA
ncbi:MAG TPA: ATP-binding protein, partial [Edaphobacter sp.]|nr:ATP-binding protein [Edaphobacter sp.]